MENMKIAFASVVIILVVVLGMVSADFLKENIGDDVPAALAVIVVLPTETVTTPVISDYNKYDYVSEEVSEEVSIAQAQVPDTNEPEVVDLPNETEAVVINYSEYSYDYINEEIEEILNEMIGDSEQTAFYLPPTDYINVSKGSEHGVAYALNNPNPSGENRFVFSWTVDDSIAQDCGVSEAVGQSWIVRGWGSWGKIPKGRIDHMTIHLAFPANAPTCTVKYNFKIEKDGVLYDTKQIEFRIS